MTMKEGNSRPLHFINVFQNSINTPGNQLTPSENNQKNIENQGF